MADSQSPLNLTEAEPLGGLVFQPPQELVARIGKEHIVEGRFAWFAGHLFFKLDHPENKDNLEFIREFPVTQMEAGFHNPRNPFVVDTTWMITDEAASYATFPEKLADYHVVIGMVPFAVGIVSEDEHIKRLAQVVLNAFKDNFATPSAPIDQENDERETRLPVV